MANGNEGSTPALGEAQASVRFYEEVLGLEVSYGGEGSYFLSLRTKDGDAILNLEHGNADSYGLPLGPIPANCANSLPEKHV